MRRWQSCIIMTRVHLPWRSRTWWLFTLGNVLEKVYMRCLTTFVLLRDSYSTLGAEFEYGRVTYIHSYLLDWKSVESSILRMALFYSILLLFSHAWISAGSISAPIFTSFLAGKNCGRSEEIRFFCQKKREQATRGKITLGQGSSGVVSLNIAFHLRMNKKHTFISLSTFKYYKLWAKNTSKIY